MNRCRMLWLLAGVQCVTLAVCAVPSIAQDVPGLTFDVTVTTGDSTAGITQTGTGWIAGKHSRIDLRGPRNPAQAMPGMPGENVSIIVHDSAGVPTAAMVDHDAKKVMYPSKLLAQMREMMAALPDRPKMRFSVTNLVVDSLGAGETVSGFATKRFRLTADVSLTMEMGDETVDQAMHIVSEGDYAEELEDYMDPLQITRAVESFAVGVSGMDPSAATELRKLVLGRPRGLPLRQLDRITGGEQDGTPAQATVTTLSNIRRAEVSPGVFRIPDGYSEMEMPRLPGMN